MYSKNITPLFQQYTLSNHLNNIELVLKGKIDKYTDSKIINIDINSEAALLLDSVKINLPEINKKETQTSIDKENIRGEQFPPGTSYVRGKQYEIEVAKFTLPYTGDSEIFKCKPQNFYGKPINVILSNDKINFSYTNYSTITGKDSIIEGMKNDYLACIDIIEKNLEQSKIEIDTFFEYLSAKITSYLTKRKEQVILREDSKNKLNPFK